MTINIRFISSFITCCLACASCFAVSGKVFIAGKCDIPAVNFTVRLTPSTNSTQPIVVTSTLEDGSFHVGLREFGDYYVEVFEGPRRVLGKVMTVHDNGTLLQILLQPADANSANCPTSPFNPNEVSFTWSVHSTSSSTWKIPVEIRNDSQYALLLTYAGVVLNSAFLQIADADEACVRTIPVSIDGEPLNANTGIPAKETRKWEWSCAKRGYPKSALRMTDEEVRKRAIFRLYFRGPNGGFVLRGINGASELAR